MSDPNDARPDFGDLSVVIPAFGEAASIGLVIDDLREHCPGCEIIVVDDCSPDDTAAIAGGKAVRVLSLPFNHGYGGALRMGMLEARRSLVAWFDADHEHRAEDLARLVAILRQRKLAAVLGTRETSVNRVRSSGKQVIRLIAWALGLGYVKDFNCGLRVFSAEAVRRFVLLLPTGYSASATSTFFTLRTNLPFTFEPITLRRRIGTSSVRLRDGPRTILSILRVASILKPLRLFSVPGLAIVGAGAAYSVGVALLQGLGLPTLGVAAVLVGTLLIGIGVVADQISQLRIQHNFGWAHPCPLPEDIAQDTSGSGARHG